MVYKTNNFYVDYKQAKDVWGQTHYLPPDNGFTVWRILTDGATEMVDVLQAKNGEIFMQTYGDSIQTHITSWELYADFIKAVDEAYRRLDIAIASRKLNDFLG